MKLLLVITMLIGLAVSVESTCCRYESIRCNQDNQLCDVPTDVEDLDQCTEECPLKQCSTIELVSCAAVLAKCLPTCVPNPLGPECVKCMAGLFQQCVKCLWK